MNIGPSDFFLPYHVSRRTAHRLAGYLEEELVVLSVNLMNSADADDEVAAEQRHRLFAQVLEGLAAWRRAARGIASPGSW